MKKIKLELTVDGARIMHGAVQKRLGDLANTGTPAGQTEKALLHEADRELSDRLQAHNAGAQEG